MSSTDHDFDTSDSDNEKEVFCFAVFNSDNIHLWCASCRMLTVTTRMRLSLSILRLKKHWIIY